MIAVPPNTRLKLAPQLRRDPLGGITRAMSRLLIAVVIGAVLGLLGPRYQSLGWYSLIPWGLAGLALGYWSQRSERFVMGALYGFALCFGFMIAGYNRYRDAA